MFNPDTAALEAALRTLRRDAVALARTLHAAHGVQWEAAPQDRRYESEARRAPGAAPSDPTADTALDARRLRLRLAVIAAERRLTEAAEATIAARESLDEALGPWDGEAI